MRAGAAACSVWAGIDGSTCHCRFDGGECGEEAYESLRLAFHDAVGYSVTSARFNFGRDTCAGRARRRG